MAASAVHIKLARIYHTVEFAIGWLEDQFNEGFGDYAQLVQDLEKAGTLTDSEILPLVFLRKHVLARLALGRSAVEHSIELLRRSAADNLLTRQCIPGRAAIILPYLYCARDALADADDEIKDFKRTENRRFD